MRKLLVLGCVLAVGVAASAVQATNLPLCCACLSLPGERAQTSAYPIQAGARTLFCSEATSGQVPDLEERCADDARFPELVCITNVPGPSCVQQLHNEASITCPAAGAPAVGGSALAALTAAMAMLGAWALRRRTQS